jgi:hypothetical protein
LAIRVGSRSFTSAGGEDRSRTFGDPPALEEGRYLQRQADVPGELDHETMTVLADVLRL